MSDVLSIFDSVLRHRGALFEGDVFSVLRSSPYVARAPEFALADGAIDCSRSYDLKDSYAERYWQLQAWEPHRASQLCLFDVKSNTALQAGRQAYFSTQKQIHLVAFFIGICASQPNFVELIPNYRQNHATEEGSHDEPSPPVGSNCTVNITRRARLPTESYGGLDPSGGPYRMPVSLLPQAIARVRECARNGTDYINPWTGVAFTGWQPSLTTDHCWMRPADDTANLTAHIHAMEIMQATKRDKSMTFNFLGLAPRVADFWLNQTKVQHKVDSRSRKLNAPLHTVAIARGERFYFTELERFDFFMMYFEYSARPPRRFCFFLPEKVIPDDFYKTTDTEASFELPEFQEYRIEMEDDLSWVKRLKQIIAANPVPRKSSRPSRKKSAKPSASDSQAMREESQYLQARGPSEFKQAMVKSHRQFFYSIMQECAKRSSGLLVLLSRNNPVADFGFCRYQWTVQEKRLFATGKMPRLAHDLPPDAALVPICYYARSRQMWHFGPKMTSARFRRLDACTFGRLIIWDLGCPDVDRQPLLTVLPSDDLQPSADQRASILANLGRRKDKNEQESPNPSVSDLLATGLHLAEYGPSPGPRSYGSSDSTAMWQLLNAFSECDELEHPVGFSRKPSRYRCTLREVNTRLTEQHFLDMTAGGDPEIENADSTEDED